MSSRPGPTIITIFGASGDLAKRKLLPALYNLFLDRQTPERFLIIGIGRSGDDENWRKAMKAGVDEFSRRGKATAETWKEFSASLCFLQGTFEEAGLYTEVGR